MYTIIKIAIICVAVATSSAIVHGNSCPEVKPMADLNLTERARATWYIQEQQINGYQNASCLFCTLATYENDPTKHVPFFKGPVLAVHNFENVGGVNQGIEGPQITLCARVADPDTRGALSVAPCFLPNFAAGPYWVLAVGTNNAGEYTWGVVSGGNPTVQYNDGCTTKETGVNGSGLWIFTRAPVGSEEDVNAAKKALTNLGYTLQRLKKVVQTGCSYKGATIKK